MTKESKRKRVEKKKQVKMEMHIRHKSRSKRAVE